MPPHIEKLQSHTSKEAAWRSCLLQHTQSGKSMVACYRMNRADRRKVTLLDPAVLQDVAAGTERCSPMQ